MSDATPTGYKKTEIGVIPVEWEVVELGKISSKLKAGGTPPKSVKEYWNGKIPFVLIEDMTNTNKYLLNTKVKISEEGLKHSSAWIVPKESLLISMYASLGEVAINKIEVATNQAILAFIPNEKCHLDFAYYIISYSKRRLEGLVSQTTQRNLNKQKLQTFKIPLPPLPEQRKIAEILEMVDKALEKTDLIIEKYKRIKQGLMQDLLTRGVDENWQIRSEETHRFKDSPLGRIPEVWEVVELGEITDSIDYGYTASATLKEVGPKFLRITDIQDNKVDWDSVPFCYIDTNNLRKYLLKDGDIVFARTGATTGKSFYIYKPPFSIFASYLIRIRFNKEVYPRFMAYFFNSETYWYQINLNISGSTQEGFNASKLKKIKIFFPPLPEQRRIAEILSQIDKVIEREQKYKEKLERLKRGLMEDLLSGRVRVTQLLEVENNLNKEMMKNDER